MGMFYCLKSHYSLITQCFYCLGLVEAWRIMISLKSGLLTETAVCNRVSNIIRNLSLVPGNDVQMAKNPSLLLIVAKLLLLHHAKLRKTLACDSQYNDSDCRWQDCLDIVRENTLVTVANIAGFLDLSLLAGDVNCLLLDGLITLACSSLRGSGRASC